MLLVLDIGNTNITCGIYQEENLVKKFRLISDKTKNTEYFISELKNNTKDYKITKCFIGSVVDELNQILKQACDITFGLKSNIFEFNTKISSILDVEKPKTIGADRIANVYAVLKKYSYPCVVVDMGSATTFDILSKEGKFFGGIIMPGIEMQLNSLCEKTSKLPKINIEEINSVIGRNTKTCILSGVIRGHACAIEGLIVECEKEIGKKITVIATGGLSELVSKYMNRKFDYIEPNLTLNGFKLLFDIYNEKH